MPRLVAPHRFQRVEDPRIHFDGGYPSLLMTCDGHRLSFSWEPQKPALAALGVITLHAPADALWQPERELPTIYLPTGPYPYPGSSRPVKGATMDPKVQALALRFILLGMIGAKTDYDGQPLPSGVTEPPADLMDW